jgi:hypothetical protein
MIHHLSHHKQLIHQLHHDNTENKIEENLIEKKQKFIQLSLSHENVLDQQYPYNEKKSQMIHLTIQLISIPYL